MQLYLVIVILMFLAFFVVVGWFSIKDDQTNIQKNDQTDIQKNDQTDIKKD